MKKLVSIIITLSAVALAGCADTNQPMTEEQQAAKYGMTVQQYRQEKSAAARMNMSWEEHVKAIQGGMDMDMDM